MNRKAPQAGGLREAGVPPFSPLSSSQMKHIQTILLQDKCNVNIQHIEDYLTQLQTMIADLPAELLDQVVDILLKSARNGRKIFLCGNGGSAANASHIACDLAKNTAVPGAPPLRVIALTDNMALMTAWANDTSYDNVFAAQLAPLIEPGDVVIGISASGNSVNVLNAIALANEGNATTIGFTGDTGGRLAGMVDLCLHAPSPRMDQQEDAHLIFGHCITAAVRDAFAQEYA